MRRCNNAVKHSYLWIVEQHILGPRQYRWTGKRPDLIATAWRTEIRRECTKAAVRFACSGFDGIFAAMPFRVNGTLFHSQILCS